MTPHAAITVLQVAGSVSRSSGRAVNAIVPVHHLARREPGCSWTLANAIDVDAISKPAIAVNESILDMVDLFLFFRWATTRIKWHGPSLAVAPRVLDTFRRPAEIISLILIKSVPI